MNGSFSESYQAFTKPLEPLPDVENYDGFKLKVFGENLPVNYVTRNVSGGIFRADDTNPDYNQRIYESYVEQGEEKAATIKKLRSFGIKIPPTYFTVGTNNFNEFHLYSSTELITGLNLSDFQHQSPEEDVLLSQQYLDLITSLCAYYKDCFKKNQQVAFDTFSLRQYVLEEKTETIYLVDTDSHLVDADERLATYLEQQLKKSIELLEAKFTSNIPNPLEPARRLTDNLSKQLLKRLPT
jgi:hypothetical protein